MSQRKNKAFSRADRERILLRFARKHLGKPYKYGARPWQAPRIFDCSSFVQYLYRKGGIELPRVSIAQAEKGRRVSSIRNLKVGDLLFLRGIWGRYNDTFPNGVGHVVMYVGEGKAIHAAGRFSRIQRGGKVLEESLREVIKARGPVTVIRRYF